MTSAAEDARQRNLEQPVPSDDDLAAAARAGDRASFNTLVRRYQRRVYGLCVSMVGPDTAEDITQETFIRVLASLDRYRGGNFAGWLLTIAGNRCRDELRRRKRRPATSLDQQMETFGDAYALPTPERSPERRALDSELRQVIVSALVQLPDDQRQALTLRDIDGFSYQEIASATNVSVGTVKSRIARARARMRELLPERGEL